MNQDIATPDAAEGFDPAAITAALAATMDEHEATCEHCRSFTRQVVDGEFGPLLPSPRPCSCRGDVGAVVRDGEILRCANCGSARLETPHWLEIAVSEYPGHGVHTFWGTVEFWHCACGWSGAHEGPFEHARETGATIAVVPDLLDWVRGRKGFAGPVQALPARPFRTFDHDEAGDDA